MKTPNSERHSAYDSTVVRQRPVAPAYPAVRVFGCFAGLGGALGGGLIGLFAGAIVLLEDGSFEAVSHVVPFIVLAMLYGSVIGLLPAALCGLWVAWRRCRRSVAGVLEAVAAGMTVTFAGMWLVSHSVSDSAMASLVGGGAALLLALAVLPAPPRY